MPSTSAYFSNSASGGRGLLLDQTGRLSVEGRPDRVDHVDVSEELDVCAAPASYP
ncbi:hypothetical protein [Streptomyces camelliae]|uniref:Uncharacterized protein n=1 Tax=Streptomyces camelliae TaxID=3004093 RepID=A0ABY7NUD9_9ACTN|nr:hypothetical protein [Streptomyces sp. HUAS 2-6]WBO61409.1 hypothetical protein O1G22_00150 [Streptomyces sp. HUAS 2-6]